MVFFVQGNIDFKKVIRTVEKAVSDISLSETNRQRIAPFTYIPQTLTINKDTHQAHVMIAAGDIMHTMKNEPDSICSIIYWEDPA